MLNTTMLYECKLRTQTLSDIVSLPQAQTLNWYCVLILNPKLSVGTASLSSISNPPLVQCPHLQAQTSQLVLRSHPWRLWLRV